MMTTDVFAVISKPVAKRICPRNIAIARPAANTGLALLLLAAPD
jgi:hypothetical protein